MYVCVCMYNVCMYVYNILYVCTYILFCEFQNTVYTVDLFRTGSVDSVPTVIVPTYIHTAL